MNVYCINNKANEEAYKMNELLEICEDLELIESIGTDSPGFEAIITKWEERKAVFEAEIERQYEMFTQEVMTNV